MPVKSLESTCEASKPPMKNPAFVFFHHHVSSSTRIATKVRHVMNWFSYKSLALTEGIVAIGSESRGQGKTC